MRHLAGERPDIRRTLAVARVLLATEQHTRSSRRWRVFGRVFYAGRRVGRGVAAELRSVWRLTKITLLVVLAYHANLILSPLSAALVPSRPTAQDGPKLEPGAGLERDLDELLAQLDAMPFVAPEAQMTGLQIGPVPVHSRYPTAPTEVRFVDGSDIVALEDRLERWLAGRGLQIGTLSPCPGLDNRIGEYDHAVRTIRRCPNLDPLTTFELMLHETGHHLQSTDLGHPPDGDINFSSSRNQAEADAIAHLVVRAFNITPTLTTAAHIRRTMNGSAADVRARRERITRAARILLEALRD